LESGIKSCAYGLKSAADAIDDYTDGYFDEPDDSFFCECLYWAAQEGDGGEPYELTSEKICLAWAKDGFIDRALTIAFIDRMRQLIWDEPFFVAWAARPET